MYEEAKQLIEQEARAAGIPPDAALSWTVAGNGSYILSTTHSGHTEPLCQFAEQAMQDIPGGYADRTGYDEHWPQARALIRRVVMDWKRNHGR